MIKVDSRGCAVSGATPEALVAYERALAATLAWRTGASAPLDRAIADAPGFVMPLILRAYTLLCSRDAKRVRSAQTVLELAAVLETNERETAHLTAIASVLADDYETAKHTLAKVLRQHPHDALALHVAHAFDYLTGDVEHLSGRAAAVLPAWSRDMPGYHAAQSMLAFGLVEAGDYDGAENAARAALESNPADARAHHVMAHVFEMTERADAGANWMRQHQAFWAEDNVAAKHCWWHLALFLIDAGRAAEALAIYDHRVRLGRSGAVADLIDASALLWRMQLHGHDVGARWAELSEAWSSHIDDGFCSFTDLHAMLAFVGARDWACARRLESLLAVRASCPTRHGKTTRLLGLPACRALMAFGRGDYTRAISLFASLPELAHRLGGSHAQRDVMHLTLLRAVECARRPIHRPIELERASKRLGLAITRWASRLSEKGASNRFDVAAHPVPGD